jgi:DNA-binding transcriptional LysR family regulator
MKKASIAEMSAFVAIAERASFARAATQLGVSRSSLSESLRAMEERLGVRLINRTTRSVALTEAGERLLAQLRPLLDNFDAALESVNAFRDSPAGHVRITVPRPAARTVIEPILSRFLLAYPAVTLEVAIDSALTDIVRDRFDAGIRWWARPTISAATERRRSPEISAGITARGCGSPPMRRVAGSSKNAAKASRLT